jgi:hypothetical protein
MVRHKPEKQHRHAATATATATATGRAGGCAAERSRKRRPGCSSLCNDAQQDSHPPAVTPCDAPPLTHRLMFIKCVDTRARLGIPHTHAAVIAARRQLALATAALAPSHRCHRPDMACKRTMKRRLLGVRGECECMAGERSGRQRKWRHMMQREAHDADESQPDQNPTPNPDTMPPRAVQHAAGEHCGG